LRANWDRCLRVPMPNPRVRSLNLATGPAVSHPSTSQTRRSDRT
jgi:tRNA(Leu) C34 or U34 (ribose-2'-O)-methylase TrmL